MALTPAAGSASSDAMDVVQEWTYLTESMDVDEVMDSSVEKRYLALDTNVLISCLKLLKELAQFVEEHRLSVEFLIAGIVVEELDNLKRRVGQTDAITGQDVSVASRAASNWLLSGLRRRSQSGEGLIRGQAYHETLQAAGHWKNRTNGESNDQLILDCCLYFASKRKVYLFTSDRNIGNQSLMNSIPVLLYESGWDFMRLVTSMMGELKDSIYASVHVSTRQFAKKQPKYTQPRLPSGPADERMIIDDDGAQQPRIAAPHPLDAAHLEICDLALPFLRKAALRVVEAERERLLRGGRDAAIYSTSRNEGFGSVDLLPDEQAIAAANQKECLTLLWRLTKAKKPFLGLVPFLLAAGKERGARRGREFSRGDWNSHGEELIRLGTEAQDADITKLGNDIVAWVALQ